MNLIVLSFFLHFFTHGYSKSDVHINYLLTMEVPTEYSEGFVGRAFLMETNQMVPNFRVALSVEAIDGKYSCSLDVFLGDAKVWNSGHFSRFYLSNKCVLELTGDGDLQLKGPQEQVGWRTGTNGQGVERLMLLRTGNLVLVDALNGIKWQSFNFPTDAMLWGQRLNVATRLTSFLATNIATSFYSLEIHYDKIGLYLNSGKWKYSYWEFTPSKNRNITYIQVGSKGLEVYNERNKKIAQISSQRLEPLRFLALGNRTGSFGLYYYSPKKGKFEASFQALNNTCDLPLACKPFGICTFSNVCSCIRFLTEEHEMNSSDCGENISKGFCGRGEVEMLELQGISSVLRNEVKNINVSKQVCASLCIDDCECVAALYSSGSSGMKLGECLLYGLVRGVKQVSKGTATSYFIKVPKGTGGSHGKNSKVRKWVLDLVGVVDGMILFLVLGGIVYYVIRKRRKNLLTTNNDS